MRRGIGGGGPGSNELWDQCYQCYIINNQHQSPSDAHPTTDGEVSAHVTTPDDPRLTQMMFWDQYYQCYIINNQHQPPSDAHPTTPDDPRLTPMMLWDQCYQCYLINNEHQPTSTAHPTTPDDLRLTLADVRCHHHQQYSYD